MIRAAQYAFAALVLATLGAFFVTQRLKQTPRLVQTLSVPEGGAIDLDARILGVAAAGGALVLGASTLPVVALAAVVTALARALA